MSQYLFIFDVMFNKFHLRLSPHLSITNWVTLSCQHNVRMS